MKSRRLTRCIETAIAGNIRHAASKKIHLSSLHGSLRGSPLNLTEGFPVEQHVIHLKRILRHHAWDESVLLFSSQSKRRVVISTV